MSLRSVSFRRRVGLGPTALLAAALLAAALAVSACSSGSSSTPGSTGGGGPFGAKKDAAIAAEVPKAIASKGSLTVATDATYPPMESTTPGSSAIVGADADLGHAIGTVLGLNFNFQNVTFNKILLGLKAGQYDLGMSSFTDEKVREQTVDFVDYFQAGTSFVVRSDSTLSLTSLSQICGKTVSVESGTTEQSDATTQSKKCTSGGQKPVTVLAYPAQTQANLALSDGRADVMMADSPVAAYQVKLAGSKFKLEGSYGVAPYGIAIPKNSGLAKPIQAAVNKLISDGVYQKILTNWGLQSGAISTAKINGAIF
jgi:polar amino acid transport system substrate-binding protein